MGASKLPFGFYPPPVLDPAILRQRVPPPTHSPYSANCGHHCQGEWRGTWDREERRHDDIVGLRELPPLAGKVVPGGQKPDWYFVRAWPLGLSTCVLGRHVSTVSNRSQGKACPVMTRQQKFYLPRLASHTYRSPSSRAETGNPPENVLLLHTKAYMMRVCESSLGGGGEGRIGGNLPRGPRGLPASCNVGAAAARG